MAGTPSDTAPRGAAVAGRACGASRRQRASAQSRRDVTAQACRLTLVVGERRARVGRGEDLGAAGRRCVAGVCAHGGALVGHQHHKGAAARLAGVVQRAAGAGQGRGTPHVSSARAVCGWMAGGGCSTTGVALWGSALHTAAGKCPGTGPMPPPRLKEVAWAFQQGCARQLTVEAGARVVAMAAKAVVAAEGLAAGTAAATWAAR